MSNKITAEKPPAEENQDPVAPAETPAKARQSTNSMAVTKSQKTIRELLQSPELKQQIQAALPKHLTPERFIRLALNATLRQPELLRCSRESFFRCLLDLSAYGIEPDGRRAHLIPFRNNKTEQMEVQLIIDYKGIAELVRRSGDVSYIHADVVFSNDIWDFSYGSGAFLKHRPNMEDRGDRVKAVYSFVRLRDGAEDFIVLSTAEVEKVRKRSKAGNTGPWVTDWNEMAKKTAFRRHSKWLPLSPEVKDAVERDDDFDIENLELATEEDGEPSPVKRKLRDKILPRTQPTPEPEPQPPAEGNNEPTS